MACRDGIESRYLSARIRETHGVSLDGLLVEGGGRARRRKAVRLLRRAGLAGAPSAVLDLLAIARYHRETSERLRRELADAGVPVPSTLPASGHDEHDPKRGDIHRWRLDIDSANAPAAAAWITDRDVDVLVVHGTSILRRPFLEAAPGTILNVHGGIVPKYRNVHSDAWALLQDDRDMIGTTIIHLDAGVDTGDIALQGRIDVGPDDDIGVVKARNLVLAGDLIERALTLARDGVLPRTPQDPSQAGSFPTLTRAQVAALLDDQHDG